MNFVLNSSPMMLPLVDVKKANQEAMLLATEVAESRALFERDDN